MSAGGTAGRDRGIDAVRAYAIAGVVGGHWLVTALVVTPDGTLGQTSPLVGMPGLAPVTWLLQTLGLFFFTGGYASVKSLDRAGHRGLPYRRWLGRRLGQLALPAGVLLGVGAGLLAVAALSGIPVGTLRTVTTLAVSPLWFLLPFAGLVALTGPLIRAVRRFGPLWVALAGTALVTGSDLLGRSSTSGATTGWRLPLAVFGAWLVPYLLGLVVADGGLGSRRVAWAMALGGGAGLAGLVLLGGYPASAVGVPGAGVSNLSPPSLAAVACAVAQVGVALLLRTQLNRWLRRPARWRPVHRLNRVAAVVYLCHQPVLVTVAVTLSVATGGAAVPGLLAEPSGAAWIIARLGWLPLLAAILGALVRWVYDDSRSGPDLRVEVIAVRDSDPPSRGRAGRQSC